jgi:hypothetical protein
MTRKNGDDTRTTAPAGRPSDPTEPGLIARLEQALEAEARTSESLRKSLAALAAKLDQLEAGFTERLEEATQRTATAERTLADQQQRLEALGLGREATMLQLSETRAELARVRAERDELLKKIDRIEGMQSSTVALTEEEQDEEPAIATLPSMDELMASLDGLESGGVGQPAGGHLLARVASDDTESTEMISPELVFPDGYADEKEDDEKEDAPAESDKPISRLLVFLDAPQPMKFPLYKRVMTIGRSEQADINVPDDFVSRVHARLKTTDSGVVVEDVASKNGIRVNSQPTDRQTLRHGDVLGIGKLRFTFIDLSAVPPEE